MIEMYLDSEHYNKLYVSCCTRSMRKRRKCTPQGSDTGVRRTEVANEEMVGINDRYTE